MSVPPQQIQIKDMSKKNFSFKRGWLQVRQCDVEAVRNDIMEALGITTIQAFGKRLRGDVEPKVSEVPVIEGVFAKYKIKDIWGDV